jgi:hypothetical protein
MYKSESNRKMKAKSRREKGNKSHTRQERKSERTTETNKW